MPTNDRDPESGVTQTQGKYPPNKRKAKASAGAGFPESGTMRPTVPPAPSGIEADGGESAEPASADDGDAS